MFLTRPSVSPSVLLFFLSAQLLWNPWNFAVMKDLLCAYSPEFLIQLFTLELCPSWTLKIGLFTDNSVDFFPETQLELWPKYTILNNMWNWFTMNDREAVRSNIFLAVNVQMLHECDNYYSIMCIRL